MILPLLLLLLPALSLCATALPATKAPPVQPEVLVKAGNNQMVAPLDDDISDEEYLKNKAIEAGIIVEDKSKPSTGRPVVEEGWKEAGARTKPVPKFQPRPAATKTEIYKGRDEAPEGTKLALTKVSKPDVVPIKLEPLEERSQKVAFEEIPMFRRQEQQPGGPMAPGPVVEQGDRPTLKKRFPFSKGGRTLPELSQGQGSVFRPKMNAALSDPQADRQKDKIENLINKVMPSAPKVINIGGGNLLVVPGEAGAAQPQIINPGPDNIIFISRSSDASSKIVTI